jgi:hypothetical protein
MRSTTVVPALILTLFIAGIYAAPVRAEEKSAAPAAAVEPEQKQQYEKTMQERLRNVGKQLDELKAKAGTKAEKARDEINQYFSDADKKGEKAAHELESLRKATNEKWEQVKPTLNKAVDDFEKAIDKAKAKLRE